MSIALWLAANAALVPAGSGHALLALPGTAVSEGARAVLAQGGKVSCRPPSPALDQAVCLTSEEWRSVARDARTIDQRNETAKALTLFRLQSRAF
ncbi:MAG: hypothetical protein JNJ92_11125 [Altererythrobacter sp.]|nr:hypothetical protein [Altererythrobacter sp.]